MSRLFVLPHEAAVAEDIGAEYGGELTFHTHLLRSDCTKFRSRGKTSPSRPICGGDYESTFQELEDFFDIGLDHNRIAQVLERRVGILEPVAR